MFPNSALIASELDPKDFGRHYAIGYPKNYKGKVIFAEIDIEYRHPYFKIDEVLELCKKDGGPKRTKFISSYRVLEHLELSAFKSVYLVTTSGRILELEKTEKYTIEHEKEKIRIYQMMAPLYFLLASNLTPPQLGRHVSDQPYKGVPKSAMVQFDVDIDNILNMDESEVMYSSPLPSIHPGYLRKSLGELAGKDDKKTKTISLNSIFDHVPFTKMKHGLWISDAENQLFYALPSLSDLETRYYDWWKDACFG